MERAAASCPLPATATEAVAPWMAAFQMAATQMLLQVMLAWGEKVGMAATAAMKAVTAEAATGGPSG